MHRLILALVVVAAVVAAGFAVGSGSSDTDETLAAQTATTLVDDTSSTTERARRNATSSTLGEPDRDQLSAPAFTVDASEPPTTQSPSASPTTTPSGGTASTAPPATSPPKIVAAGAIPATVPYPKGLDKYGGHEAILSCGASTEDFDCEQFGSNHWWDAPYLGTNLPYTTGYAWVDGDRQGYSCAYGFLQDLSTGELIGRWAALLPPGAEAYGKVNDRFMSEGVRYYDGELANEGGNELSDPNKASECYDILSDDIDYEAVNTGADERPRIGFFNGAGQIIDIRDYSNTALSSPGKFKLLAWDGNEAVVGFYPAQNNKAAVTFYYTAMGSGQLAVDFNGTGPYQP